MLSAETPMFGVLSPKAGGVAGGTDIDPAGGVPALMVGVGNEPAVEPGSTLIRLSMTD